MIKLRAGNVLLKPSHRKQLMTWLKRALRLGDRLGDFVLTITMHRAGRSVEVRADVHDRQGDFAFRARKSDWQDAIRELGRMLSIKLHEQYLRRQLA